MYCLAEISIACRDAAYIGCTLRIMSRKTAKTGEAVSYYLFILTDVGKSWFSFTILFILHATGVYIFNSYTLRAKSDTKLSSVLYLLRYRGNGDECVLDAGSSDGQCLRHTGVHQLHAGIFRLSRLHILREGQV